MYVDRILRINRVVLEQDRSGIHYEKNKHLKRVSRVHRINFVNLLGKFNVRLALQRYFQTPETASARGPLG